MTPILLLALAAVLSQDHGPQSLTVTVTDPYAVIGPDWRIHAGLTMADGRPANGRRAFDAQGIARFESLPPGEGALTLEWLPPGSRSGDPRAWLPVLRRPLVVAAGQTLEVRWDLGPELALVDLTFIHPPEGFQPEALTIFYSQEPPPGQRRGDEASWTLRNLEPTRIPAPVGALVNAVTAADGSDSWASILLLDSWTVTAPGPQAHEILFPDGRIEVKLIGEPPPGAEDWSDCFIELEADPRTTALALPLKVPVEEGGLGSFVLLKSGDYFLKLTLSEDGDWWFTNDQVVRLIHFEGGELKVDFTVSGTGGVEIQLPLPPAAGGAPPEDAPPELKLQCIGAAEGRTIPWPAAGEICRVPDLPVGRWTAVATQGRWSAYSFFEVEAGQVTRLTLPTWAPQIPVAIKFEGMESEPSHFLWVVDPRGRYESNIGMQYEDQWFGLLAPGAGRVVIQPAMGPRREIPFEVPAALPEGKEWVVLVLDLN